MWIERYGMSIYTKAFSRKLTNMATPVRRLTPALRCLSYLSGSVVIAQSVGSLVKRAGSLSPLVSQSLLFGTGTLWTALFLKQQKRPLSQLSLTRRVGDIGTGALLGCTAFGLLLAIGRATGSISIQKRAATNVGDTKVVHTVIDAALTHGFVAWNEELVFRGYGFDVTQAAIGKKPASVVMLALFGLYHQWRWQVFLGEVALGGALLALRLLSGDVWLSIGYHWAWNLIQTGIIGPVDGPPAPLVLHVRGPYWLVGRPGHPEPGLLTGLVNLGVVAFAYAASHLRQTS